MSSSTCLSRTLRPLGREQFGLELTAERLGPNGVSNFDVVNNQNTLLYLRIEALSIFHVHQPFAGGVKMKLSEYFENAKGYGVLATADSAGKVDVAMYARPHFMDEETIAFIMPDRLTHHNLQSNPHAAYLFMETGEKLSGKRLFLTKIKEEKDSDLLYAIRRKSYGDDREGRYLVYFKIDKVLPLIGAEEQEVEARGKGKG